MGPGHPGHSSTGLGTRPAVASASTAPYQSTTSPEALLVSFWRTPSCAWRKKHTRQLFTFTYKYTNLNKITSTTFTDSEMHIHITERFLKPCNNSDLYIGPTGCHKNNNSFFSRHPVATDRRLPSDRRSYYLPTEWRPVTASTVYKL